MFKYAAVSGISLLTHNVVMIVADSMGANLLVAVLASFCIVVVIGYILHTRFTFDGNLGWRGFARYVVAMSLNIPLALLTTGFWRELGLPMVFAAPLSTAMMMVFNYIFSRWAVVPAKRKSETRKAIT